MDKRFKWKNKSGTPTYYAWRNMIRRCYDSSCQAYRNYGGRGITVCEDWRHSYDSFVRDMGERPDGLTLDRTDNSKGYSKENCAWVTFSEQSINKRTNRIVTFDGLSLTIAHWADRLGLSRATIYKRLDKMGLSEVEALSPESLRTPLRCGTVQSYQNGCRCRTCKNANNKKARDQRARRKARMSLSEGSK